MIGNDGGGKEKVWSSGGSDGQSMSIVSIPLPHDPLPYSVQAMCSQLILLKGASEAGTLKQHPALVGIRLPNIRIYCHVINELQYSTFQPLNDKS